MLGGSLCCCCNPAATSKLIMIQCEAPGLTRRSSGLLCQPRGQLLSMVATIASFELGDGTFVPPRRPRDPANTLANRIATTACSRACAASCCLVSAATTAGHTQCAGNVSATTSRLQRCYAAAVPLRVVLAGGWD